MSRRLAPFAAAAALLLSGCEVYAVPDPYPCPGVQQGVFDFSGTQILDPLPTCYFAQPGSSIYQVNNPMNGFQATISFDADVAALCVGNAHAVINFGNHGVTPPGETPAGTTIDVYYPYFPPVPPDPAIPIGVPISVGGCTCPSTAAVKASGCTCPSSSPTSNCSCPALLLQNIKGTMVPRTAPQQGFSQFVGTMNNKVSFRAGLAPEDACDCLKSVAIPDPEDPPAMSCSYSYSITAPAVNGR